jgi:hypothetical protein
VGQVPTGPDRPKPAMALACSGSEGYLPSADLTFSASRFEV